MSVLEKFVRAVLSYRRMVILGVVAFVAAAVHATTRLPIEAYPDVTNPMAEVVAVFPGQAAEEVERRVTLELEGALAGIPKLLKMQSTSVYGLSLVSLTFDDGTDMDYLRARVSERLVQAKLPDGVDVQLGPAASPVGQIYRYTLRGGLPIKELRALQQWTLERRIKSVPGVADVVTFGGFDKQYQVRVDPELLTAYGVSLPEVYAALQAANRNAGGGYIARGPQEFIVRGVGTLAPDDIGEILVRATPRGPIRVRDVSTIAEGAVPRRGSVGRNEENESVEGIVLLRRGANPSTVLAQLDTRLEELRRDVLPPGVEIVPFDDRRVLVHAALGTVVHNLIEGALLVVAVLYVFLRSLRGALIVAVTIPLSLLAALLGLYLVGLPANLISLGAIDFGVLVEASVIVVEASLFAIERARRNTEGRPSRDQSDDALSGAVASVVRPVGFAIAIVLVTIAPIFALERVEGRLFAPMAWSYLFALIGSVVCAFAVVPALERVVLPLGYRDVEPRWLEKLRHAQDRLVAVILRKRYLAVAGWLAVVSAGAIAARGVGSEFLPELREGGFYVTMIFPPGISLDETRRLTPELRKRIRAVNEVSEVISHIGRPDDATQTEGPNNLELFIKLKPEHEWPHGRTEASIEADLRAALVVPGVDANFSQPITDRVYETISGIVGQVVVKIHGTDSATTAQAASAYVRALRTVPGISDLSLYQAGSVPQLRIDLDRTRLAQRGITVEQAQDAVEIALGGKVATEVWEGERRFGVAIRVPDAVRNDPGAVERIVVADNGSGRTTLGDVAAVNVVEGRIAIKREDFSRFSALKFNVRGRDLGTVVEDARRATAGIALPAGAYATWGGEFENAQRAMSRLSRVVPIALFTIFILLAIALRSASRPLLILLFMLPLGIAGATIGLRVMGLHFSVSAAIGCIALFGQLVLGSVLSLERVIEARAEGVSGDAAIREGFSRAFRPVSMALSLALFGLLPLAMSHAMGAETQRPFAVAILFGCLVGGPSMLLLLPAFESMAADLERNLASVRRPVAVAAAAILAFMLIPSRASAEVVREPDAVTRMLRTNGFLAASQKSLAIAEADVLTAKTPYNPSFSFGAGYSPIGPDVNGLWFGNASLSQPLLLSGQLGARAAVAEGGVKAAHVELEGEEWMRAIDTRRRYLDAWSAQATDRATRAALADVTAISTILEARAKAGMATGYDAMRIDLERQLLDADVRGARVEQTRTFVELETAIGDPTLKVTEVADVESVGAVPDLELLLTRAMSRRSELRVARAHEGVARLDIDRARIDAKPIPQLSLGVAFSYGPNSIAPTIGLSIPLPVFNIAKGPVARATAEAETQASLAAAWRKKIDAEVRSAREKLVKRRDALEEFQKTIGQGAVLRKTADSAYAKGGLSLLELLDAYRSERELARRAIQLRFDVRSAELDLLAAVGGALA